MSILSVSLFIPVITFASLFVLLWIVNQTKTGLAMRAVSTDLDAARLMAIDVNKTISFTFGIGSLLAGLGGIMWTMKYPAAEPADGRHARPQVLHSGGHRRDRQHIGGAVLGGFLLGIIEIMIVAFLPELTGYRDAFAFVLLIVVLLVKPAGLLGKSQAVKV